MISHEGQGGYEHQEEVPARAMSVWDRLLDLIGGEAWMKVLRAVRATIRQIAPGHLRDDLEADTVARLVLHARAGKPVDTWEGLAVVMARNLAIDARREAQKRGPFAAVDPDELPHHKKLSHEEVMASLPGGLMPFLRLMRNATQRRTFAEWATGASAAEIAERHGQSVASVEKALGRMARKVENLGKSLHEVSDGESL
jgi:DNA-directed RNA polymerase specialized sigma24 family protein